VSIADRLAQFLAEKRKEEEESGKWKAESGRRRRKGKMLVPSGRGSG
jgi:hypothetical protein